MLKFVDTKVTFAEVPNEISLCISLSGCPMHCKGCHSSYLQEDIGTPLTTEVLGNLIDENKGITCVCFLGGDNDIPQLDTLAQYVKKNYELRTAWYSGLIFKPRMDSLVHQHFDYIKTGPYIESLGPLTSRKTNQKMYAKGEVIHKMDMSPSTFYDITDKFWKDNDTDFEEVKLDIES